MEGDSAFFKLAPISFPSTAWKGNSSNPMTSIDASSRFDIATTSSILMNELPMTTTRLPFWAAEKKQ
jgi:hypothetical protein